MRRPLAALPFVLLLCAPPALAFDDIGDPDEPGLDIDGMDDLAEFDDLGDPDEPGTDPDLDDFDDFDMIGDPDEPGISSDPIDDFDDLGDPDEPGFASDPLDDFELLGDPDEPGFSSSRGSDRLEDPPESNPAAAGPPPTRVPVAGKSAMADNYDIVVVSKDLGSLTLELPVLVSHSREELPPGEFWLVAEVKVDGTKVTEARQWIGKTSVADLAPTVAWLKVAAPVAQQSGTVEFVVWRASVKGEMTPLFTRSLSYQL